MREAVRELLRGFARWRDMLETEGHVVTLATMLDESGYTEMWQQDKSAEAPGRLENLKELVRAMADFETLAGFLDHVSLVMENEEQPDADRVSLMTLHGAKGLEFDTVFLPGWEEGMFPSQRTHGRERQQGSGGRAAARLCRAHPRAQARDRQLRREPAHLRQLAEQHSRAVSSRNCPRRMWSAPVPPPWHAMQRHAWRRRRSPASPADGAAPEGDRGRGSNQAGRRGRETIAVGARVFHQKFGYGTVTASDDDKLDIAFETGRRRSG